MSFLPSFGPFAGILFVLTNRLRLRKSDLAWGLAALASAVAVGAHQGILGAAFGAVQVLGPWALFRAFGEIRHPPIAKMRKPALLHGLFAGFVVLTAIGLGHVRSQPGVPDHHPGHRLGRQPDIVRPHDVGGWQCHRVAVP